MVAFAPGRRKYWTMSWIKAFHDGVIDYGRHDQPATTSNIVYYVIEENAVDDSMAENFRGRVSPYDQVAVDNLKSRVADTISSMHGGYLRDTGKVQKDRNNHLSIRKGYESRQLSVTEYELTEKGENYLKYLDERYTRYEKNYPDAPTDTMYLPLERDFGWVVAERVIPRVHNGEIIE